MEYGSTQSPNFFYFPPVWAARIRVNRPNLHLQGEEESGLACVIIHGRLYFCFGGYVGVSTLVWLLRVQP